MNGVSKSKPYFSHKARRVALVKVPSLLQDCQPGTTIAPSLIDKFLSGIYKSTLNSFLYPILEQSRHASKGLLKENDLGSISSILISQSEQEKCWLKLSDVPFITSTWSKPSYNLKAASTLSVNIFCISSFITNLSTTISIVCLIFLSRLISSDKSYVFPSTSTRTYPDFLAESNTFSCLLSYQGLSNQVTEFLYLLVVS